MKKIILLTLCSFALLDSCKKTEYEEKIVEMYFKETLCANPWETTPESTNYLEDVKKYLEDQKIKINSIEVRRIFSAPTYGNCNVLSGRRLFISIDDQYITKAQSIGFILIE